MFIDGKVAVKPDTVREALRFDSHAWHVVDGALKGWTAHADDGTDLWTFDDYGGLTGEHDFHAERPHQALPLFDGYLRVRGDLQGSGALVVRLGRGLLGSDDHAGAVRWSLRVSADGVTLTERRKGAKPETLVVEAEDTTNGDVEAVELAYVDGVLRARVGKWTWSAPREAPYYPLDLTVGARDARIHHVALDHDVHYANLLILGVPTAEDVAAGRRNPHRVPEGHLFFLGDNSRDSKDSRSRDLGDVPAGNVVGPVGFRIWPPSRVGGVR